MNSTADPYLEWNGAYILGSLSPSERREYEQHLSECPPCARTVASLAGMAGPLSTVPTESAMALLSDDDAGSVAKGSPANTLPDLLHAVQRARRGARARVVLLLVVVAAVVAATAVHLPLRDTADTPAAPTDRLVMEQTIPSLITADTILITERWGTRIEGNYRYTRPPAGAGKTFTYALYVNIKDGASTEVASWTAAPGSAGAFAATTRIPLERISSVDIRLLDQGIVLLTVTL